MRNAQTQLNGISQFRKLQDHTVWTELPRRKTAKGGSGYNFVEFAENIGLLSWFMLSFAFHFEAVIYKAWYTPLKL